MFLAAAFGLVADDSDDLVAKLTEIGFLRSPSMATHFLANPSEIRSVRRLQ